MRRRLLKPSTARFTRSVALCAHVGCMPSPVQWLITKFSSAAITLIVPRAWLKGHAGCIGSSSARRVKLSEEPTNVQAVNGSRKRWGVRQVDIYTPMKAMLAKAWVLWELTMLAEPLMVVAPTPGPPPFHHTVVLTHRTHHPAVLTRPQSQRPPLLQMEAQPIASLHLAQ